MSMEDALSAVRDVLNEHPETQMHVRLDGFKLSSGKPGGTPSELFDDAVKEGQGGYWYTTQREMAFLERAYRLGNLPEAGSPSTWEEKTSPVKSFRNPNT
ncbi:hypothetical protein [Streptomyces sp. NPDC003480]